MQAGVPQKELDEALTTGRGDDDRWHQRKDGTRFWASGVVTRLKDEGGTLRGFCRIMRDCTDLKRSQDQLAESQRRHKALFDHTLDAVLLADDEGRYVDVNNAACSLLGLDRDDLLRRTVLDITPPPDVDAGRAAWDAFLRDGTQAGEYAVRRPDGTQVVVEYRAVAHVQPGLHLSVLRDATEREALLRQVRTERERLADVFQQAPAFMAVVRGPEHVFEQVNDRYLQLVGHRDLLGKPVQEALPEVAGQGLFELLDGVYQTGEPFVGTGVRVLFARRAGEPPEERYVDFVYQALREPGGVTTGVVAVGVDVTDRWNAEERLRESEARLVRAQAVAKIGSWETDLSTMEVAWSSESYRIFEVSLDQRRMTHQKFLEHLHPNDRAAVDEAFCRSLDHCSPCEIVHRIVLPDGRIKFLDEHWQTQPDGLGRPVRVVGTCKDITQRKQAEDAIRLSEARYRGLADAMPQIVWVTGPDGYHDFYNRQWYEYTGLTIEQSKGDGWNSSFHPDDRLRASEGWRHALATDEPFEGEYRRRRHDGEQFVGLIGQIMCAQ